MPEGARLIVADCLDALREMEDGSIDAVVCDPPYELGFMGKAWDGSGIAYNIDLWRDVLRVLKPGGHLLAFGGTRTYHRLACAIEDAGFEIRDSIHWVYGSGFPKSLDVSKAIDKAAGVEFAARPASGVGFMTPTGEGGYNVTKSQLTRTGNTTDEAARWQGWGTALKPAHEPIVVARKPLAGTVAQTVLAHGTGAINIDGCRVGAGDQVPGGGGWAAKSRHDGWARPSHDVATATAAHDQGRWPPNFLLTHAEGCEEGACVEGCPVREMDAQSGTSKGAGRVIASTRERFAGWRATEGRSDLPELTHKVDNYGDTGGASRFFPAFRYQAKASRRERNAGLDGMPERPSSEAHGRDPNSAGAKNPRAGIGGGSATANGNASRQNHHPTVKPVELMRWLVRLVTPPGGVVLDPFTGSGTTGVAAVLEGFDFIGIEREPEYAEIAERRIAHAQAEAEAAPVQLAL